MVQQISPLSVLMVAAPRNGWIEAVGDATVPLLPVMYPGMPLPTASVPAALVDASDEIVRLWLAASSVADAEVVGAYVKTSLASESPVEICFGQCVL